jgi:hypothetical protein
MRLIIALLPDCGFMCRLYATPLLHLLPLLLLCRLRLQLLPCHLLSSPALISNRLLLLLLLLLPLTWHCMQRRLRLHAATVWCHLRPEVIHDA